MPKAIKKKIARPSDEPVEVENALHNAIQKATENKETVQKALIALAVVIIAVVGIYFYISGRNAKAAQLEYQAYKTYQALYEQIEPSKMARAEQALALFQQAYDAKKSAFSLYYIAICQYDLAQYEESANTLVRFLAEYPDDARFATLAYYKLAMANMMAGKLEDALRYFNDINNIGSTDAMKDVALIESARLLERMGRPDEATSRYQTIVTQFPTSYYVAEAKQKLGIEDKPEQSSAQSGGAPLLIQPEEQADAPLIFDLGGDKK